MNNYRIFCDLDGVFKVQKRTPEGWQTVTTTIQPNQAFDTPIEPLYTQKEDDAYWGQFRNDTDNCPF